MNAQMKIKKGDMVLVTRGKDRGKKGKVLRVFPVARKILVEGINQRIRHVRPRKAGEKGQRLTVAHPLWDSNTMVICPSCGRSTRVGYRVDEQTKTRICKKCGANI